MVSLTHAEVSLTISNSEMILNQIKLTIKLNLKYSYEGMLLSMSLHLKPHTRIYPEFIWKDIMNFN